MDVFMNDPIVDWITSASAKQPPTEGSVAAGTWEPARKIRNAKHKLDGPRK